MSPFGCRQPGASGDDGFARWHHADKTHRVLGKKGFGEQVHEPLKGVGIPHEEAIQCASLLAIGVAQLIEGILLKKRDEHEDP